MTKADKPFHGSPFRRAICVVAACALILVPVILLVRGKPRSLSDLSSKKANAFLAPTEFQPSLQLMNDTEVIWHIPSSPKALLFIAHGCQIRASNFWDKSPGCPHCDGLPEERLFVLQALERKFAVLTISSLGVCWSFGKEMENVEWIIRWWIEKNQLEGLPMTALGASSGGYFVSALAARMWFSSITIMIAEGAFDEMPVPENYPPTLFVHMPKDRIRMGLIRTNMEELKKKGVDVREVRCPDFPLSPNLLSERIPGLSQSSAVELLEIFREKGFLDEKGYMKRDARATPWKEALKEGKILSDMHELINQIGEELNLAYGFHEFSSLKSGDIFEWFESHMNRQKE